MNILIIHNRYQIPGGEDEVVRSEKAMLERFGHKAVLYERSNVEIEQSSFTEKMRFAVRDVRWSPRSYREIREIIRKENIDLVHAHNTFLVISPSVYQSCRDENVPVVQTLHNYRFLCPNGLFYRDGHICTDCLKFGRQSAIVNRCWRNSFGASLMITKTVDAFYAKGILQDDIQHYIALSDFSRRLFVQNGLPEGKVSVKPNFFNFDPGSVMEKENYALYIGGFFSYKGVETLVSAWRDVGNECTLKMIGDGPLFSRIQEVKTDNIELLGRRSFEETIQYLRRARFLIVPSECYENFPRVIVEAFACGVPVAASDLGAMRELIREGITGVLFEPRNSRAMKEKVQQLIAQPALLKQMGKNARQEFEEKYTQESNYARLMDIYSRAVEQYSRS